MGHVSIYLKIPLSWQVLREKLGKELKMFRKEGVGVDKVTENRV